MFNTQVSTPKAITYSTSENTSVNKFDATVDIPSINLSSYIQLPSVKQDAAKLKPNAVNEKEQEIAAIVNAAKMLESEYASYVDEFVTRGNQALYAVLAKIYAVAVQINHSDNKESIIKSLRNVMSLQKKIKTQKNSSALTLLVRWVVGGSRQLAHTYSKALEAAYTDNIAADELAAYFTKQGGLNGASKRNSEQKEVVSTVRETEFNQFMRTADICSKSFENTKIKWTEEVFMNNTSGHAMILGHNSGGGNIHGYRAFNLSNEAFKKISKILADELFKAKREDEIAVWVKQDSDNAYAKKSKLAQGAVSA
jgi:hypothetical protein